MGITIEDVPEVRGNRYPKRISVSLTSEAKQKLEALKDGGKDTAELVRMLIDEFLAKLEFDRAG